MKIAEEQIDRLLLLTQKLLNQQDELKRGEANHNSDTGIFIMHPWEAEWQDKNIGA